MAITTINVGNIANDGTGDDLREAFIKVNANFADLDGRINNTVVTAANIGTAGQGVYADTLDNTLQFKKIVGGTNTTVTANNETVIISSSGGMNNFLVLTDNGSITVSGSTALGLEGGEVISTRVAGSTVFFDLNDSGILARDTAPTLSQNLNANDKNIANVETINANSFIGPLTGLVYGVDVRNLNEYFDKYWNFGEIVSWPNSYETIIDYIVAQTDVDCGDFIGSNDVSRVWEIDLGTI